MTTVPQLRMSIHMSVAYRRSQESRVTLRHSDRQRRFTLCRSPYQAFVSLPRRISVHDQHGRKSYSIKEKDRKLRCTI